MKKFLSSIFLILFLTPAYSDKLLRNGFINNETDYAKKQNIKNPKNKIILIYNHGQKNHDAPSKRCTNKDGLRNISSFVGEKINGKKVWLYLLCTGKLKGDNYKTLWNKKKFKPPYKGKTKLEKRLDANLKLIDYFVSKGVPNRQIILTGHSCGGWITMMLIARYPDKVGGGISFQQACYGQISRDFKVKKVGVEKALETFRKKQGSGPADMRQNQINEIKESKNLPVLVFTHPKDPFDGLISDLVEDISGVKRIIISKDNKVNGKLCHFQEQILSNYHKINKADCFQYYHKNIKNYLASRMR